jgi:hypothetical protein
LVGGNLAHGDNEEGSDVLGGALMSEVQLNVNARTATGVGDFYTMAMIISGIVGGGAPAFHAHVGWQPNSMVDIRMGGWMWTLNDINRMLPFHRQVSSLVNREMHQRHAEGTVPWTESAISHWHPFMLDRVQNGVSADFNPISMFRVGFALPYTWGAAGQFRNNDRLQDILQDVVARVRVDLDGIGRVGFGYDGNHLENHHGDFFGFFHLSMLNNIGLDFGVRFQTAHVAEGAAFENSELLAVGVGANFDFPAMNMGVRMRGTAGFGIGDFWGDRLDATRLSLDVLPWMDLTDNIAGAIGIGGAMNLAGSELSGVDPYIGWMVNPYVSINIGQPRFNAGFRLFGHNNRGEDRNGAATFGWEIPVGMSMWF